MPLQAGGSHGLAPCLPAGLAVEASHGAVETAKTHMSGSLGIFSASTSFCFAEASTSVPLEHWDFAVTWRRCSTLRQPWTASEFFGDACDNSCSLRPTGFCPVCACSCTFRHSLQQGRVDLPVQATFCLPTGLFAQSRRTANTRMGCLLCSSLVAGWASQQAAECHLSVAT